MAQHEAAYVTLVMTDSYLPGAMVLGHSLKDRGAKARLAACVLMDKLSLDTISELQTVYDDIVPVEHIVNMQPANLYLMNRPDLISTFTKIELWRQTQYKRLVYLDADMVVLRAPNELLTMNTNFAAVPDVGWPDCFNSGVMVLNPDLGDYYSLKALASRGISFDGADQGLLNMHFTEWERISFAYNCTPNANYQYVPAYKHFQSSISMIHFIGQDKPWTQGRDANYNSGVYGELLARWWSVYDRHYRISKRVSYEAQPRKRVQDYVKGEEIRYEPPSGQPQQQREFERRGSSGYQITQPQPQPPPGIHVTAPQGDSAPVERPFGDQPSLEERINSEHYKPIPTQEQRRFSAPYAEWNPEKQPPPPNSKPEAANFPTQQYEWQENPGLFEAPEKYPEPPKDMWYNVPETQPVASAPLKKIFPWEENAPKATRVFPKSRESTPPSEPTLEPTTVNDAKSPPGLDLPPSQNNPKRRTSLSDAVAQAFARSSEASQRPPSPSRHVFPWESRAPKPTRVFAQDKAPSPPPNTKAANTNALPTPSVARETEADTSGGFNVPKSPDNPWDAFAQQSNKWDEDPEISRFMESFNKPRKAPVQLVHQSGTGNGPPPARERRTSLKLTDFPTEVERPSLPVTPAPIRRPTLWGSDERETERNVLPLAKGVPRQDEWVRLFTSQSLPNFPNPFLRDIKDVLHLTCQHCGQQNPIVKLEELQRKQSLVMSGEERLETKTPPRREMPESDSREQAIEATMRGINVSSQRPKTPTKPILKSPHFEVTEVDESELRRESLVATAHTTATGSKSPTRFNPIVLEGEAASVATSYGNTEHLLEDADLESSTATHHHSGGVSNHSESTTTSQHHSSSTSGFSYSTSSLSPTESRTSFHETVTSPDALPSTQVA